MSTHNEINKLWFNPTYISFKKSKFARHVFSNKDSIDFIKTGAYLINEAEKLSNILIPWDNSRKYEILNYPRLENAYISLGGEYFLKGIFLEKGYAINKLLETSKLQHPFLLKNNKSKLDASEVYQYGYIISNLPRILDFSDYDKSIAEEEAKAKENMKGQKMKEITRMTIPYPNSRQMLDYLLFKRNYALHRPFIMPEFRGTTQQTFRFFDFVAKQVLAKTIKQLAILDNTD